MHASIAHFAINSDQIEASRRFCERVFGWKVTPWGPPGFYQIEGAGLRGALQGRRDLVPGQPTLGMECTIAVESIEATERAVLDNGGKVLMPRTIIAGVGTLMFVQEPGGTILGAMQYDARAE